MATTKKTPASDSAAAKKSAPAKRPAAKAPAKTPAKTASKALATVSPAKVPARKIPAKVPAVKAAGREAMLARVESVRLAQRGEGHFDCFGRAAQGYCDQGGCAYHAECLSVSRLLHSL